MNRGYFGIGIYDAKREVNFGTLMRSAYSFGASFIFTVGHRFKKQASDTCKTWRHLPVVNYKTIDDLIEHLPHACPIVAVELCENARQLNNFCHPLSACYLLGAEDVGLPKHILDKCPSRVVVPKAKQCLNVAVAGSIVMYDRVIKQGI